MRLRLGCSSGGVPPKVPIYPLLAFQALLLVSETLFFR